MKRLYLILSVLFLFNSCSIDKKGIIGSWAVDVLKYKNEDVVMKVNMLLFKRSKCSFPHVWDDDFDFIIYSFDGNWSLKRNDKGILMLNIELNNNLIFDGSHQVRFFKDEKEKMLKMEIKSDNLYMLCTKFLVNYDTQQGFIDALIEMTN